jgi:ssDNA-binding Zn-finger/Zn-ribbon topoisomerase 1
MQVITRSPIRVTVNAEHRNGICIECGSKMEVVKIDLNGNLVNRARCPNCGGGIGQLIARPISIQAPDPPQCLSFKCLGKFIRDSLFSALLSSYHFRRVAYAEANRPEKKKILDRYRTVSPAPKTLWQAIHANIKLRCPICRRYNVDPFYFGGE